MQFIFAKVVLLCHRELVDNDMKAGSLKSPWQYISFGLLYISTKSSILKNQLNLKAGSPKIQKIESLLQTHTVNWNVNTGVTGFRIRDSPGIRGKENEVLVKDFKGGSEDIGEFTV
ncbi:hypothetical protein LguiA_026138 [Lonicera macranthoides]